MVTVAAPGGAWGRRGGRGRLAPAAARDSGLFAAVLLGVPVVLAAVPMGWDLVTGRPQAAIDWLAAVLAMGWAVLLALGIGLAFVPAALLQLAAAATGGQAGPIGSGERFWIVDATGEDGGLIDIDGRPASALRSTEDGLDLTAFP